MSVLFKDFRPPVAGETKVLFITVRDYEMISEVLPEVNSWISDNNINVINVETLVLPNLDMDEGSHDSSLRTSGEMTTVWFQVIRVWYREE